MPICLLKVLSSAIQYTAFWEICTDVSEESAVSNMWADVQNMHEEDDVDIGHGGPGHSSG
jgi:hypothetical protein